MPQLADGYQHFFLWSGLCRLAHFLRLVFYLEVFIPRDSEKWVVLCDD